MNVHKEELRALVEAALNIRTEETGERLSKLAAKITNAWLKARKSQPFVPPEKKVLN